MTSRAVVLGLAGIAWIAFAATTGSAHGQEQGELERSSFLVGDVLVVWQSGKGATIAYRGIPLFAANPAEFVVHRAWQDIFHHAGYGEPRATLAEVEDGTILTIRNRTEHFAYTKRIIARKDGSVRLEYECELLDPDTAELQGLFGLGKQWIDGAKYQAVVGGEQREGELSCPETGRLHPWSNATEQVFTTDYGTLTITAERGLALYAEPQSGVLWWTQALTKGARHTQTIEARIEPGPAAETGLALNGLKWLERVRDGRGSFTLQLARTAGGPDRVRVHAELATGSGRVVGESVEVDLSETPTEVECGVTIDRKGNWPFAVVIADAGDGTELLRIAPLQVESAPMIRVLPRLSLYTGEEQAEIVVDVAEDVELEGLAVAVRTETGEVARRELTAHRVLVPLDARAMPDGSTSVQGQMLRGGQVLARAETTVRKAAPKPNEVKIDHVSRGLIADGLPFIPFGYYTYYPLKEGVMDEEVVRGFTLFSPYHGGPHSGDDLEPIREYMDRCAAIGMKVNYHVMWANRAEMTDEQWAALRTEIETFRDHPALLSWYIADEPAADRVPQLEEVNRLLKELDPHHPVTIVFYRGGEHARQFAEALDIVMGDPYPIPSRPVTYVSEMADALNEAFDFTKPLWIVPQCFGGHEGWRREPTPKEQRVMTYLALVHGATGIQYFIRSPRISFPKSPIMWAECGALALETAELTPALLSAEPRPEVTSSVPVVHASAYRDRGIVTVLAVNTENRPHVVRFELEGVDYAGDADVLFEDREVSVEGGAIEEPIDAFGTRAYAIPVGPMPEQDLAVAEGNLTVNPSYENNPSVGTPAGCYASIGTGATFFVDSRVARHGRHSLRMIAPSDDQTPSIRPFPVSLKSGQEYRVSIWAKAKSDGVLLGVSLGGLGNEQYSLTTDWQEYGFSVTPENDIGRASAEIGLRSAGVAWLDLFQIVPIGGESQTSP